MVDVRLEEDLGRRHRVVVSQVKLCLKETSFVGRIDGSFDLNLEVSEVLFVLDYLDSVDFAKLLSNLY